MYAYYVMEGHQAYVYKQFSLLYGYSMDSLIKKVQANAYTLMI